MKFRTKHREIEAEQFWSQESPLPFPERQSCYMDSEGWYVVTADGQRIPVVDGDWIVRDPAGRGFYPLKPDVIDAMYEEVG